MAAIGFIILIVVIIIFARGLNDEINNDDDYKPDPSEKSTDERIAEYLAKHRAPEPVQEIEIIEPEEIEEEEIVVSATEYIVRNVEIRRKKNS